MKTWKKAAALLLTAATTLTLGCAPAFAASRVITAPGPRMQETADRLNVTLIVAGQFGDRSFYDGAKAGAERLERSGAANVRYIECRNSGYDEALRQAAEGADMVLAVGWEFENMTSIAAEYPNVKFIWPDVTEENLPDNLECISYAQNEGAFLAGYLAASLSESGKVGMVGGMDNEVIRDFLAGYLQGAAYADPEGEVRYGFTGDFDDVAAAKAQALSLADAGCDVIFHAAGASGTGVFEAAAERDLYAIGVDSDQKYLNEDHIVASVVKNIGASLYNAVLAYWTDGSFEGGTVKQMDLRSGYLEISYGEEGARQQVGEGLKEKVRQTADKIRSGEIVVETTLMK